MEKFREIAEAYAVLSNKQMKYDFDTRMVNNPDSVFNQTKFEKGKPKDRNEFGNEYPDLELGEYGQRRVKAQMDLRKRLNLDNLGYFKGGGRFVKSSQP